MSHFLYRLVIAGVIAATAAVTLVVISVCLSLHRREHGDSFTVSGRFFSVVNHTKNINWPLYTQWLLLLFTWFDVDGIFLLISLFFSFISSSGSFCVARFSFAFGNCHV